MTECLIRLPWPPSKTSKNGSQGDFYGKARAAKNYKATCAKECWAQSIRHMGLDRVAVTVTYHPPTNGRIDWDNMAARCKQGFDAVAEAIGVDDGNWWPVTSQRGPKVKGGAVLVHVKEPATQTVELRGTIK